MYLVRGQALYVYQLREFFFFFFLSDKWFRYDRTGSWLLGDGDQIAGAHHRLKVRDYYDQENFVHKLRTSLSPRSMARCSYNMIYGSNTVYTRH